MNFKNLPIVQNLSGPPSNPIENQCYFNTNSQNYYIYANNQWNLVSEYILFSLYYYLRYTTTTNSDWTLESYTSLSDLNSRLTSLTNLKNIEIYYGSTTQPTNEFIISQKDSGGDRDYVSTIDRYQLINGIYVFTPVAQLYPKIIFNDTNIVKHLVVNDTEIPQLQFSDTYSFPRIWFEYPAFQLEIIEHSTPVDSNIGYKINETVQLEFKYTYQGTISNLQNINLYSLDDFTVPLNETFNINSLNATGSFYRNYIVKEEDAFAKNSEKRFSCILSCPDINQNYQTNCFIMIPMAVGTKGYIVEYETIDGTTGSANYATYTDLFAAIPKDTSPFYKNLSITEGVYYASV